MPAVVVLLAGLAATAVATTLLAQRERAVARLALERQTAEIARRIEHGFVVPLQAVFGVSAYLRATGLQIDRAGFQRFTAAALAREPAVYALEWAPVVTDERRAQLEASAQAEGLAGWQIIDKDPTGAWIRAATRPWYVPLLYAEPPNAALGFDLASLPDRRAHIVRARDGAHSIVSERLQLVEDPPGLWAVAVYEPVWRDGTAPASTSARAEALAGFAICVFRVRPVIERALTDVALADVDAVLADPSGHPDAQVLWESRPGAAARALANGAHRTADLGFVDRTWRVTVAPSGDLAAPLPRSRLVLVGGVLLSALLAALVVGLRTARRLARGAAISRQLGQYTLLEAIGTGGMGVVYAARHVLLRRPTAVKLLLPDATDPAALERFEREVRLTAELTHPNVIAIYDFGHTPDGVFYYAMELLDGLTLDELIAVDGPQAPARTVHLITQLTSAIAEAHDRGLVHRDLKPANLMIVERGGDRDFVKVLDFGLVKRLAPGPDDGSDDEGTAGDAAGVTRPGIMLGTPGFSAPEAMRGEPSDVAGDIYAIGAITYALLAGRPPFKGSTPRAIGTIQMSSMPPPPSKWRPAQDAALAPVPPALDALVLRCMARSADLRPASARALLEELAQLELPAWTRADADRWWSSRGAAVRPIIARRRADQAGGAHRRDSVAIDLARRRT